MKKLNITHNKWKEEMSIDDMDQDDYTRDPDEWYPGCGWGS